MDFVADVLDEGRELRCLNVDDCTRECRVSEADTWQTGRRAAAVPQRLSEPLGVAQSFGADQAPEFEG